MCKIIISKINGKKKVEEKYCARVRTEITNNTTQHTQFKRSINLTISAFISIEYAFAFPFFLSLSQCVGGLVSLRFSVHFVMDFSLPKSCKLLLGLSVFVCLCRA